MGSATITTREDYNPDNYEIGCLVGRFQIHELHEAHYSLIKHVVDRHSKVILFLGVSVIQHTDKNPLDFASRRLMISEKFPDIVILPLIDMRDDKDWSRQLDKEINKPFGNDKTAILYGGRDSFIPYYSGKYPTIELESDTYVSGTEVRKQVSKEIKKSSDFRAGVIYGCYTQRPCPFPTVDFALYKGGETKSILLAKKPNENKWRFPGGFFDLNLDKSLEDAAIRELNEECGDITLKGDIKYVTNTIVNDWRYRSEKSKILTTLFFGEIETAKLAPNDDVSEIKWVSLDDLKHNMDVLVVDEHIVLVERLLHFIDSNKEVIN